MKIYLWFSAEGWKLIDREKEKDFELLLKNRGIEIGYSAQIGDLAKIGKSAKIGNFAKIGDSAEIGNSAQIGDSAISPLRGDMGIWYMVKEYIVFK